MSDINEILFFFPSFWLNLFLSLCIYLFDWIASYASSWPVFYMGGGGHDAFSTVVLKMLTLKEKAKLF